MGRLALQAAASSTVPLNLTCNTKFLITDIGEIPVRKITNEWKAVLLGCVKGIRKEEPDRQEILGVAIRWSVENMLPPPRALCNSSSLQVYLKSRGRWHWTWASAIRVGDSAGGPGLTVMVIWGKNQQMEGLSPLGNSAFQINKICV